MKLFTKSIDNKLFAQFPKGGSLEGQKVIAKIFNPYGRGRWYIMNSDPEDPDYLWGIVELFDGEPEVGSFSRSELENLRVGAFKLGLERDLYFDPMDAMEVYRGLKMGNKFEEGGTLEDSTYLARMAEEYAEREYGKKAKPESTVVRASKLPNGKNYYTEITVFFTDGSKQTFEQKDFEEFFDVDDYAKGGRTFDEEQNDKVYELTKHYTGLGLKPYFKVGDVTVRIKDHIANWDNTERYNIQDDDEEVKFLSIVIADDPSNRISRESTEKVEEFISKNERNHELVIAREYIYPPDAPLSEIIEDIDYYVSKMQAGKENFAKGGLTEHGLKRGDTIKDDLFWENAITVTDKDGKLAKVDLAKGIRKESMAKGGELSMGIETEMKEHGMSKAEATKTAKDHLRENPNYYSKMKAAGLEDGGQLELFAKGGATFDDKVRAIKRNLVGKKVPKDYQDEYGKRYDKNEAEESARRIAGAMQINYKK
jgi:hypothetical protein